VITVPQRYGRTDGLTTCHLRNIARRAVKLFIWGKKIVFFGWRREFSVLKREFPLSTPCSNQFTELV